MLPHWTCSNPLFHQCVHCCGGQITILLEWIGLEVLTFSWAPSIWEPHFAQPQIELQEPHTFHPTWASLWDMRSSSHLQEPDSCKVKIEGSESQSCCYSQFNTMIQNIHEKCLHLYKSQCLSFFASILWCIQNGDGLKQDLTTYGWKLNMKVNFGEHILLSFGATYLNLMKRFGDFHNFWSKSNERKSPRRRKASLLISSACFPVTSSCCRMWVGSSGLQYPKWIDSVPAHAHGWVC
jgi:hypothetical protein